MDSNEVKRVVTSRGRNRRRRLDPLDPALIDRIEPWVGAEVRMRCGGCDRILDVLCGPRGHDIVGEVSGSTGKASGARVPSLKTGRPTYIRPHIRREYRRAGEGVSGMTWYCPCGREHARNFAALVDPFISAARAEDDLVLD